MVGSSAGQAGVDRSSVSTKALLPPLYRGGWEGGVLESHAHLGQSQQCKGGFPRGQMAKKTSP